jgi:N-acetylneuraminic acid mutarotase
MGFAWSASRGRLLLWPGSYVVNSWNRPEYAKGLWEFNPATNAWTQRLTMFAGGPETWTGNLFGGVFDEQTDTIYSFGDDSTVPEVKRWNVTTGVASTLPFPPGLQRPAGHAAYFRHGQHARIGRWIYVIGAYSDGIALTPMMFRYNIDTRAIEVLPQPPVNGSDMALIEIRVGVSGTKIVWPFTNGPEGVIRGIYVYDTVSRLWMVDNQRPSGFFGGNAVVSLPDGRVGFSGGAGGPIPTHIWFYKAAS